MTCVEMGGDSGTVLRVALPNAGAAPRRIHGRPVRRQQHITPRQQRKVACAGAHTYAVGHNQIAAAGDYCAHICAASGASAAKATANPMRRHQQSER